MFYKLINFITNVTRLKKNFILTISNKIFVVFFIKFFFYDQVSSHSGSNEINWDWDQKNKKIDVGANIFKQGTNPKQYTNLKVWKEAFINDKNVLSVFINDKNFGSINEKIIIKPLINFNESANSSNNDNIKTDVLFVKNYMHPSYAQKNAFHRFSQSNKYTTKKIFYSDISSIETLKDAFTFVNKWFNYIDGFINQTNIDIEKDYQVFLNKKFFSIETFKFLFNNNNKQKINIFEKIFDINFNKNIKVFYNEIFFEIYKNSNFFNNFSKYNDVEYNNIYNNNMQNLFSINFIILIFFISSIIISFYNLIISNNAVSAITFFFIMIICFAAIFFYISTEYIASIVLMVYVGAIIIFFIFILFSSDIKRFSYLTFNNKFNKPINFSFAFIFFIYFIIFYFFAKELIIPFSTNENFYKTSFNSDRSFIIAVGNLIYNNYYYHITILGFLLLSSLFGAIEILNPILKKKKINKKKINKFINKLMFWHESFIDIFFILALIVLSMSYSCIATFNHSFIHIILIFESMILSICVIIAFSALVLDLIDGEIFILFIISVVAAETAVAISLFIKISIANPNKQYNYLKKKSYKNIVRFFIKKNNLIEKENMSEKRYLFSDIFSFILTLREEASKNESSNRTKTDDLTVKQLESLDEAKTLVRSSFGTDNNFVKNEYINSIEESVLEVSRIQDQEVKLISSTEITLVEETSTSWFTIDRLSITFNNSKLIIHAKNVLEFFSLPLRSETGWQWPCFMEEAIRCYSREFIFSLISVFFNAKPRVSILWPIGFIDWSWAWKFYWSFKNFHVSIGRLLCRIFNFDEKLFWNTGLAQYIELGRTIEKNGGIPRSRVWSRRHGMTYEPMSPLQLPEYQREWGSAVKTDSVEMNEYLNKWRSIKFPERPYFQDMATETSNAISILGERKVNAFFSEEEYENYKRAKSSFITFYVKNEPEALSSSLSKLCNEPIDGSKIDFEIKIRMLYYLARVEPQEINPISGIPEDRLMITLLKQLSHHHEALRNIILIGDSVFCKNPQKGIDFFDSSSQLVLKHWFFNRPAYAELTAVEPTLQEAKRRIPQYNPEMTQESVRTPLSRKLLDREFVKSIYKGDWDYIEKVFYQKWKNINMSEPTIIRDLTTFSKISNTIDKNFYQTSIVWKKFQLFFIDYARFFEPMYIFIWKVNFYVNFALSEFTNCTFSFFSKAYHTFTTKVIPYIFESIKSYVNNSFTNFFWFFKVERMTDFLDLQHVFVFFKDVIPITIFFLSLVQLSITIEIFIKNFYYNLKNKYKKKT